MTERTSQNNLESSVELLLSLNLKEEQAHSILIKLWFLIRKRKELLRFSNNQKLSIEDMLISCSESWGGVLHNFEYYKVSKIKISFKLFKKLEEFLKGIDITTLIYRIKDDQTQKLHGRFFSPHFVINPILDQIKNELHHSIRFSIIDFSAGLGYFLTSFLGIPQSTVYAIELDPLTFEVMLLSFLFNPAPSNHQKMRLLLTVKQGDSLLGYHEDLFNRILNNSKQKELLIEYMNTRLSILDKETNDISHRLKECFRLRNEISKSDNNFSDFNWFIDFPELFIDAYGKKLVKPGVDYVIGNPPWISYPQINLEKYSRIFKQSEFADLLHGKFNFYLPFVILAYKIAKIKGGMILPQALFTEAYSHKFREFIFKNQSLYNIRLWGAKGFKKVVNEFCTVMWDQEKKSDTINLVSSKREIDSKISYSHIQSPFYRLPLMPAYILEDIKDIINQSNRLDKFIVTRRGFTLTKKYQMEYNNNKSKSDESQFKKIVRNSIFTANEKKGIFNFQVFYSADQFVYDRNLLGAPGSEEIFERPKIIRRNRGRQWFIGLDLDQNLYVNDIFDIIYVQDDKISLKALFGYLCSSFIQLLAEGYLQRDITSNIVRSLPIPNLGIKELSLLEQEVDGWIKSRKTLKDFETLRKGIDLILSENCGFFYSLVNYLKTEVKINWKEV